MKDLLHKIIKHEDGNMTEEEEIKFFQELIDSGDCWKLQGHYGRTARDFITAGVCKERKNG